MAKQDSNPRDTSTSDVNDPTWRDERLVDVETSGNTAADKAEDARPARYDGYASQSGANRQ